MSYSKIKSDGTPAEKPGPKPSKKRRMGDDAPAVAITREEYYRRTQNAGDKHVVKHRPRPYSGE